MLGIFSNLNDSFTSTLLTPKASSSIHGRDCRSLPLPFSMLSLASAISGINNYPSKMKKGESLYAPGSVSNDHIGT